MKQMLCNSNSQQACQHCIDENKKLRHIEMIKKYAYLKLCWVQAMGAHQYSTNHFSECDNARNFSESFWVHELVASWLVRVWDAYYYFLYRAYCDNEGFDELRNEFDEQV